MTEQRYTTTRNKNHCTFAGEIYQEDFNTNVPNKNRARQQINNERFEKQLSERTKKQKERQYYQNMTLEDLRKMKIISNTDGRPSSDLTDERWQSEFEIRKLFITPHNRKVKKLGEKYSRESGMWDGETQGSYCGCTSWQSYCSYINDVLSNIRSGQTDYCYYIFQILELAGFHYDTLKTRYCDGYWEVWLEKEEHTWQA